MALTLLHAKKLYLCKRNVTTLIHVFGANEQLGRGRRPGSRLSPHFAPLSFGGRSGPFVGSEDGDETLSSSIGSADR